MKSLLLPTKATSQVSYPRLFPCSSLRLPKKARQITLIALLILNWTLAKNGIARPKLVSFLNGLIPVPLVGLSLLHFCSYPFPPKHHGIVQSKCSPAWDGSN